MFKIKFAHLNVDFFHPKQIIFLSLSTIVYFMVEKYISNIFNRPEIITEKNHP